MPLVLTVDPIPLITDANGVVRIQGSRVTLDTVVTAFLEGATAEEILEQYPSLQLSGIYTALGYYLRHKTETAYYLAFESVSILIYLYQRGLKFSLQTYQRSIIR